MNVDLARIHFAVDEHLSLPVRPCHDRPGLPRRDPADDVVPRRRSRVQAPHQVLRHSACHQRRDRRRHRARAGVRVRDELVELLALRRRRVRSSARHGRARGVLPRVDVPGPLAVRLGSAAEAHPPRHDLARGVRWSPLGRVHHGGQLVDAASRRVRDRPHHEPAGAEQHRCGVHEPGVRVGIRARRARITRHRITRDARRVRVAPVATARRARSSALRRPPSWCWSPRSC